MFDLRISRVCFRPSELCEIYTDDLHLKLLSVFSFGYVPLGILPL